MFYGNLNKQSVLSFHYNLFWGPILFFLDLAII